MKAMRTAVMLLTTVALLAGMAYGAGIAYRYYDEQGEPRQTASGPIDPGQTDDPTTEPAPIDEEPTLSPPEDVLQPGDRGDLVRELQHRLFQVAWFAEQPTGVYDAATREAVAGFQGKRGLDTTGVVDERTWARLVKMTREPTHDEKHYILEAGPTLLGPGATGDPVRNLQARLKSIAWYFGNVTGTYDAQTIEAVRGFQEKRGIPVTGEVDQRTLDRLHAMTYTPTYQAMHNIGPKPGPLDPRCEVGRVLCIDKSSRFLSWVVDGEVLATYEVRFGSAELPTREGEFRVFQKSRDHVSTLYDTSMPFAMFFSGGQAVHYSPDFAATGYNGASHGCVNVRDYNGIAWLFDQVHIGDKVIVYWS